MEGGGWLELEKETLTLSICFTFFPLSWLLPFYFSIRHCWKDSGEKGKKQKKDLNNDRVDKTSLNFSRLFIFPPFNSATFRVDT